MKKCLVMLAVGWYLMGPAQGNGKQFSISSGYLYESFDSARQCEVDRDMMHKVAKDMLRHDFGIDANHLERVQMSAKALQKQIDKGATKEDLHRVLHHEFSALWSQCIASDDPRLGS